jgi:hypothetical protein
MTLATFADVRELMRHLPGASPRVAEVASNVTFTSPLKGEQPEAAAKVDAVLKAADKNVG